MDIDQAIDNLRTAMAAVLPFGAIADAVWGCASDPDRHEDLIAELDGAIRTYITNEATAKGWAPRAWDDQLLSGITKLVARAMIEQHLFTETTTNRACLAPFADPVREPEWIKHIAIRRE